MKSNLFFDFSVNKENNTIVVKREFDAGLELVWKAWTTAELLDQWWAPRPYRLATKSLELKKGGVWLYAMISPENEAHWCKADYKEIRPSVLLSWLDAFCDEQGNENTGKPRSFWTNTFTEENGITTVTITLQQDSLADIEMLMEMGFKEGFTMAMGNLDELLTGIQARQ